MKFVDCFFLDVNHAAAFTEPIISNNKMNQTFFFDWR